MSESPAISVCIVTGRRNDQLDDCLRSLQAQENAPSYEVLVCADADPDVEPTVRRRFPDATVLEVPKTLPSAGRNHLIEIATGDLLLFLDDDIVFGPDLLAHLVQVAERHPDGAVFGGPNDTPLDSSRFQVVQGAVLASLIASGPVRRRYGAHPAATADERWFILCNMAVRRSVMRRFDEELVCAEENALLTALHDSGAPMYYDPKLAVYHERRPDLASFVRQMYKYGWGRGQLIRRSPRWSHPIYLLPSAVLLYLVAAPLLFLVQPVLAAGTVAYTVVVLAGAAKVAHTLRRISAAPLAALLIVVVHACYGSGVLRGILRPGRRRAAPVDEMVSNR